LAVAKLLEASSAMTTCKRPSCSLPIKCYIAGQRCRQKWVRETEGGGCIVKNELTSKYEKSSRHHISHVEYNEMRIIIMITLLIIQ
jgi:hypothetical protein